MRISGMLLLFSLVLAAQTAPSADPVRGTLLERDPQTASGEFSVRLPDNHVVRYRFDSQTQVEKDQQSSEMARLQPGERVEVASDALPGLVLRYARSVHVLADPPVARPLSLTYGRAMRNPLERAIPVTALGFAGVVYRLNGDRVILHTREAGDQTFLLSPETRYLQNGGTVPPEELKPNMRVFVRAVRTLYNELEAYQVIWGQILLPH